jgi:hypothetical protein
MIKIVLASGLVWYALNYITGWLLYFKKMSITKRMHQLLYALIIVHLILLLYLTYPVIPAFVLILISLVFMALLPIGRKGEVYHIVVSSGGLAAYMAGMIMFIGQLG